MESTQPFMTGAPTSNPLIKHFRNPAVYLKLPSGGKFWPDGSIELTENNEYPVLPMTARDEMMFNTPDALMNGQAIVDVIHSCIPNIKNAWAVPTIDFDSILIAIRIASYGEFMDFDSSCAHCKEENSFSLDLRTFLSKTPDVSIFEQLKEFNGLKFKFRPQPYKVINDLGLETYQTQRMIQLIENQTKSEEEKISEVNDIVKKMTEYTVGIMAGSILSVETPEGVIVDDYRYIKEFINNCDSKTYKFIKSTLDMFGEEFGADEIEVTCESCNKTYKTPWTFNNANFFG